MRKQGAVILLSLSCLFTLLVILSFSKKSSKKIIGHRGGVVDSSFAENSLSSLIEANKRNYYMVEIDIRLSRDGQLITQHDDHFKKYFNLDRKPSDMNWDSIHALINNKDGGHPMLLEEVLKYCKGKLQIMVDNKIKGNDTLVFKRIGDLLKENDLFDKAMFIGTEEIRNYFYGKTNCGYNKAAIEKLQQRAGFNPKLVYLFDHGNVLKKEDIEWANKNNITVVPSINKFHYTTEPMMEGAKRDIENLKNWGVEYFQIDSEFDNFLR